jgi:hypothetical protein
MSVSGDILATYRGPGAVVRRLLAAGPREDRALVLVLAACVLAFVAQLPGLARQAHLTGAELPPLMGSRLLGTVFFAPLFFYGLAAFSHLAARLLGGQGDYWGARLALFWALLAVSPLVLVQGLVVGMTGPGPAASVVSAIGFAVFVWFWGAGLRQAERQVQ